MRYAPRPFGISFIFLLRQGLTNFAWTALELTILLSSWDYRVCTTPG
jgi:hypothetical protein